MMNFSNFSKSFIKATGKPYLCLDNNQTIRGTEGESVDHNTTTFSTTENISGLLLRDTTNGSMLYLAGLFQLRSTGLHTGLLYQCQQSVTLYRYETEQPKDTFGRSADTTKQLIATDIPLHWNSSSISLDNQPDAPLPDGHYHTLVQNKYNIKLNDILVDTNNESYIVRNIQNYYDILSIFYLVPNVS